MNVLFSRKGSVLNLNGNIFTCVHHGRPCCHLFRHCEGGRSVATFSSLHECAIISLLGAPKAPRRARCCPVPAQWIATTSSHHQPFGLAMTRLGAVRHSCFSLPCLTVKDLSVALSRHCEGGTTVATFSSLHECAIISLLGAP